MAEWGRKEYSKKWPSRTPVWTWTAVLGSLVFFAGMLTLQYERSWSAAERLYLTDYLKSGARGKASATAASKYTLLEGVVGKGQRLLIGDEIEEVPAMDGRPGYRLTEEGVRDGIARLTWVTATFNDRGLHRVMGEAVYANVGSWEFYEKPFWASLAFFVLALFVVVPKDRARRMLYKHGRRLRGPELVTTSEFNEKLGKSNMLRVQLPDGVAFINEEQTWWEKTFHKDLSRWARVPREREAMHFLIVGDSGTGKSAAIRQLLSQVWERGEAAIVYDPAMEYLPQFYNEARGDVILNPMDARCPFWSPGDGVPDLGFSYSSRGEVTDTYESTANSGGYYHISSTFWANGLLDTLSTNVSGYPTITYAPDGEGRVSTISLPSGQNPVTATTYNTLSQPTAVTYGSLDSDAFGYSSNTGLPTSYAASVNGVTKTGTITNNTNGTVQKVATVDNLNSSGTQTCTYTYDDEQRIVTDSCGTAWTGSYSYDAFGNISKSGSTSFMPTYNLSTNRYQTLPAATPVYDANGNVTADGFHTYAWDAEGRTVTIDSGTFTYDALDRRLDFGASGSYQQYFYPPFDLNYNFGQAVGTSGQLGLRLPSPAADQWQRGRGAAIRLPAVWGGDSGRDVFARE